MRSSFWKGVVKTTFPLAPEIFFPHNSLRPARLWGDNSPHLLSSHCHILNAEVFKIQSAFQQGLGDFVPAYQGDSLFILFIAFPEEITDVILHFLEDTDRSQHDRELKDWEATENNLNKHCFTCMVEPGEAPGLNLELEIF